MNDEWREAWWLALSFYSSLITHHSSLQCGIAFAPSNPCRGYLHDYRTRGRGMSTQMLGGLTIKELARRMWRESNEDNVWGGAAQLGYYFLLALFPMLI